MLLPPPLGTDQGDSFAGFEGEVESVENFLILLVAETDAMQLDGYRTGTRDGGRGKAGSVIVGSVAKTAMTRRILALARCSSE